MSNLSPYPQLHAGRDEPILEPDLPIVDSAHHLFDRPALRYMTDDFLADVRSRAAGLARDLAGQDGSRGGTQA